MYLQVIKNIMTIRGLNRADIAKLAGVSRAAVSRWFKQGEKTGRINVETETIFHLADALNIAPDTFLKRHDDLSNYQTTFLWDGLYPDMESFLKAIVENRPPALARLVQVLGFYKGRAVAGHRVFSHFHTYKNHIHPARRKALEILWPLYTHKQ